MNSPPLLLFLLSFGHMCTDIVQGALPALLPYLKDRFSLSYTVTGTLLLAAHLTSSVIQPLFGYATDRRPFPILLALGCLVSGAGIALVPFSPGFGWLVAFVMFTGLGTAAFHPEGFKATACIASVKRATGMSLFSVGGNLGFSIGAPAAIFLVSRYGLHGAAGLLVPAALAGALFLPALPHIRRRISEAAERPATAGRNGVERPLYAVSLIVLIVVFRSWTQLGLATYIPFLYRAELSDNPDFVAMLLFLFLGAGTIGTLAGGPLADRIGHRKMLFASMALQVPLIHLFLISKGWLVFALAAAVGATIVSTFSVTIVMAQELFPRRMATASGAIAGFAIGTGGIGVTLLGMVADRYGVPAAAHLINILPAAGALLALWLPLPWKQAQGLA
ncbi:MAG TPA: MFS transporter [Candidatus Deferrimicrobiaceae bacterium]|jgi:FSR family fosmidomycin resistance protein-like MFS transporter